MNTIKTFFKNTKKYELAGYIFLAVQILLILITNLVCSPKYVDCDSAKLMEHIIKMWEHKSLAIDGWFYSTTIEWDCVTIFAIPLYGLTKNIFFACSVSNLIFTLIFVYTLFFIFRGYSKMYPLAAANLILLPWGLGMLDYFNMLFFAGSQYIVKVLVPLMLIALLLYIEKENMSKWWKKADFMVMLVMFLFFYFVTTASSSIYVTASGLVPVLLAYFVYKFLTWTKVKPIVLIMAPVTLVLFVLGYIINASVLGGTRGDGMAYADVFDLFTNFQEGLVGIFELFGGTTIYEGTKVMDYYGIIQFFKFVFVLFLLANAFLTLSKVIKGKAGLLKTLLVSVFFWNWLILILTRTTAGSVTYEYRYHLIGMIPLMILSVVNLLDMAKERKTPRWAFAVAGYVLLLLTLVISYKETLFWGEQNPNVLKIIEYFEDSDFDRIYIFDESNESDKLRLLGNPTHYIDIVSYGQTWAYDFYGYYKDGPIFTEGSCLIMKQYLFGYADSDDFFGYKIEKVDQVGDYAVYYFVE